MPGSITDSTHPPGPASGLPDEDGTLLWALAEHFSAERRADRLQQLDPSGANGSAVTAPCLYTGCEGQLSLRVRAYWTLLMTPNRSDLIELAFPLLDTPQDVQAEALGIEHEEPITIQALDHGGATWKARLDALRWKVQVPQGINIWCQKPRTRYVNGTAVDTRTSLVVETANERVGIRIARAR